MEILSKKANHTLKNCSGFEYIGIEKVSSWITCCVESNVNVGDNTKNVHFPFFSTATQKEYSRKVKLEDL